MERNQTGGVLLTVASAVVILSGLYLLLNMDYAIQSASASNIPYGDEVRDLVITIIYAFIVWEFATGSALALGAWAAFTNRLKIARTMCLIGLLSLGQMLMGSALSLVAYIVLRKAGQEKTGHE